MTDEHSKSVNMQPYTDAELDEIRAMDKTSLHIKDRLLATIESDRSRFSAYLKLERAMRGVVADD